jgi:hypothetical protein
MIFLALEGTLLHTVHDTGTYGHLLLGCNETNFMIKCVISLVLKNIKSFVCEVILFVNFGEEVFPMMYQILFDSFWRLYFVLVTSVVMQNDNIFSIK